MNDNKLIRATLILQLLCLVLSVGCATYAQTLHEVFVQHAQIVSEQQKQQIQLQNHMDRLQNIDARLEELKGFHISERLTALEAGSEVNQKLLIATFLSVLGVLLKQVLELFVNMKSRKTH